MKEISRRAETWQDHNIVDTCCDLFQRGYRIDDVYMDELTWVSSL